MRAGGGSKFLMLTYESTIDALHISSDPAPAEALIQGQVLMFD